MKIVADKDIPFLKGVLEPFAEVVYLSGEAITRADVADCDALLVRTRTRCNETLLAGSRVRFIGTATIGFDHIDTRYCDAHGITLATAAGSNARAVLQWVGAALAWLSAKHGMEPARTTLGVVGVGNIGSLVAKYASEWGFRVMQSDPPKGLNDDLSECDIVTFHVPLSTEGEYPTRHLVDRDFVARLKPRAVIINSSRGPVADDEALRGRNYILDVWNGEPAISRTILTGAMLATPHIAGYSSAGKATATAMIINALARKFGLPLDQSNWFPPGQATSIPREISWQQMCAEMPRFFDIAAQSATLKSAPERFEEFRNTYIYREEFF